jgi:hypothetical protein
MTSQEFIRSYCTEEFPHRDELVSVLSSESRSIKEPYSTVSCSSLLGIYRGRAQHLKKFNTPHANALQADTKAFCRNLEITAVEQCRMWNIEGLGFDFLVIVEDGTNKILGCLRTVSKLKVDEPTWKELWGEATT